MERLCVIIILLVLSATRPAHGASCGWLGEQIGTCELAEKLLESTKELSTGLDNASRAIPKAKYEDILFALNDPNVDAETKARYKAIADNLFGEEIISSSYQLNVAYGLKEGVDIETDFFYATTGDRSAVDAYCKRRPTYQPQIVSNSINAPLTPDLCLTPITAPLTPDQRRGLIAQRLGEAIELLGDRVNVGQHTTVHIQGASGSQYVNATYYSLGRKSALTLNLSPVTPQHRRQTQYTSGHVNEAQLERRSVRVQARDKIHEAMELFFGGPRTEVSTKVLTRDYRPYGHPLIPNDCDS